MPDFAYTARELSGQNVSGVLTAASKQDALSALAAKQLFPIHVAPTDSVEDRKKQFARRVSGRHLVVFYMQLSDLLRSGVPLLRSLELLERQTHNATLRLVLQDVREHVAEGTRLADAMHHHERTFGELAVSMVRAGEEGGFVEDVLARIASFTEHQQELKNRVVGAMVYPAFLTVAMVLIVTGMLVFFVPRFEQVFKQQTAKGELPWATSALLALSEFAQQYWLLGLVAVAGGAYLLVRWLQTEQGRLRVDQFRIRAWGLGPIVRSLAIARFCRILGTLLHNGIPILQSMRIAKDATGNVVIGAAIGEAAENVSEGKSLAGPLAASRQFPEDVVEMIAVGEEANNLEQVLINIADNMERRTNRLLDMAVRMLEPLLLTVMAGVVLFVVVALLLPILKSTEFLG